MSHVMGKSEIILEIFQGFSEHSELQPFVPSLYNYQSRAKKFGSQVLHSFGVFCKNSICKQKKKTKTKRINRVKTNSA